MKYLAFLIPLLTAAIPAFTQKLKPEVSRFQFEIPSQTTTPQPVDTTLTGSQIHNPLYASFSSWSELGNTGLPALINQYRPVRNAMNPLIFEGADGYGIQDDNLVFYSAKSPFSMVNYCTGGKADKNGQTIRAIYARNIKKTRVITVFGNAYMSNGHYDKQKCNSSAIRANYLVKKENYKLVTGFSRHVFSFTENGGLKSDDDLKSGYLPSLLSVNLSGAATKMVVLALQGAQSTSFHLKRHNADSTGIADSVKLDSLPRKSPDSRAIRLAHTFRISSMSRKFSDVNSDSSFYKNTYSGNKAIKDSMRFIAWTNDISLLTDTIRLGKHPVFLKGGINPDFYRYQRDSIISSGYSLGLNGNISKEGRFASFDLSGTFVAAGYPAGDYSLEASCNLSPGQKDSVQSITLELFTNGCSQDPVTKSYLSNYFRWDNDFQRQHESGLNVLWNLPGIRSSLKGSIISNKGRIFLNADGVPEQLTDRMMVLSLRASKEFIAGPFRSSLSALAQYSTSDIIRLPVLVGSTSTFMHHEIRFPKTKGEIHLEYGFDLSYSSGFYGYSYMPATGVFLPQDEKVLGNYPRLNIFAQFKIKRTRIFFEWCETFAGLMPDQSFAVLHYPSMRPHLKYGIYWHFYD